MALYDRASRYDVCIKQNYKLLPCVLLVSWAFALTALRAYKVLLPASERC